MLPALLFAYANNNGDPLPELIPEKDAIASALDSLRISSKLLYEDGIRTTSQLTNSLLKNQRVCLFHFAGHAGSRQLLFEDNTAEIKGVVPLLKLQKQLFLVVLNGCSTIEQVERLLEVGIPAVIATQSPINDSRAREFARILYEALAAGKSLKQAFDAAVSPRLRTERNLEQRETERGIDLTDNNQPDELKWVLRYRSENEVSVQTWTLPQGDDNQSQSEEQDVFRNKDEVNRSLTEALYDIIDSYQPEKLLIPIPDWSTAGKFVIYKYKKDEKGTILHEMQDNLLKALPYPIGEQIRLLLEEDIDKTGLCSIGKKRLIKLINAFDIMTELLLYVLMAQLWKEINEGKPTFLVSESCRKTLYEYFNHTPNEFRKADVLPVIRAIREVLQANQVTIFIDEIGDLKKMLDNNQQFRVAYEFMQLMKQAKIDNKLKVTYRKEAEYHFIILFRNLGFITRYNLLNIRDISVVKRRYLRFDYKHSRIALDYNRIEEQGGDFYTSNDCFDNHSILLVKYGSHQIERNGIPTTSALDYLNLSPFVIDNNALKEEPDVNMLFFECCDKNRGIYSYKQITNSSYLISFPEDNEEYQSTEIIDSTLEVFKEFINFFNSKGHGQDTA